MCDQDLPLLSNIYEVRARHYLIHLEPNFNTQKIQGRVYIFFEATTSCEKKGQCCTRKCFCSDTEVQDVENASVHINQHLNYHGKDNESIVLEEKTKNAAKFHCDNSDDNRVKNKKNTENIESQDFEIILDCCDIRVKCVTEVECNGVNLIQYLDPTYRKACGIAINFWTRRNHIPLQYAVNAWCIRIWKEGIKNVKQFPQAVCIEYETTPQGKSLLWRNDQDGNPCVFTPAAAINNRSLLPCQDPPSAMATWQAWITIPKEYYVSMTGDNVPTKFVGPINDYVEDTRTLQHISKCCTLGQSNQAVTFCREGTIEEDISTVCIYYYTTMVLPIATIAIAIGRWETKVLPTVYFKNLQKVKNEAEEKTANTKYSCCHYEYPCHMKSMLWNYKTPLTIVYPPSSFLLIKPLSSFLPYALEAAVHLLGTYPCCRLELVVLPPCFGSLGLASPNLIFLSPTVVGDDPAAYIRLAHEISHAWFGINIGAQDWTEEWLSEGFATYMEDSIYAEAVLLHEKARHTVLEETLCQNSESEPCQKGWEVGGGRVKSVSSQVTSNNSSDGVLTETDNQLEISWKHDEKFNDTGKECNIESLRFHDTLRNDINQELTVKDKFIKLYKKSCPRNSVCDKRKKNDGQSLRTNMTLMNYTQKFNKEVLEELSDLRAHIRYRTLVCELENSTEDLQTLRPMQGENLVDKDGINYVKNGLNPGKTFLQVHYLKGYFLLKYLSKLVSRAKFDMMLKEYVSIYHGQLILSKHALDHFINSFPEVLANNITQETLCSIWLHQPGLNAEIKEMYGNISNSLVSEVTQHFHFWLGVDKSNRRTSQIIKKTKVHIEEFIFPDQLVLLFEYLLQLPKMSHKTLGEINEHYNIGSQCGDVRHRWCELVIKNNYKDLNEVERFLLEDQSMGVYLYGELIIYKKAKHKHLAEKVFHKIKKDMDDNARLTVFSMLYGD